MEADQLDLSYEFFKVRNWLHNLCVIHSMEAAKKGVRFYLDYPPNLPECLNGDPSRLKQVLDNLLSNAIKFTENGYVRLSVSFKRYPTPLLQISVTDTGIGINKEQTARVFERFVQADVSTTRHYGGTGLGLAICQKLCEVMRGDISLQSEPGKGSTFLVKVPVEEKGQVPLQESSVSIVNDDLIFREVIERVFSPACVKPLGETVDCILVNSSSISTLESAFFRALESKGNESVPKLPSKVFCFGQDKEKTEALRIVKQLLVGRQVLVEWLGSKVLPSEVYSHLKAVQSSEVKRSGAEAHPQEQESQSQASQTPILIVEDNPVNLFVFTEMLRGLGFSVEQAENGQEAIDRIENTTYQLVFMDCMMPQMSGYTAVAKMRRRWKSLPPIIAITANALSYDRQKCLDAGYTRLRGKACAKSRLDFNLRKVSKFFRK